jgi:hypothetical protein
VLRDCVINSLETGADLHQIVRERSSAKVLMSLTGFKEPDVAACAWPDLRNPRVSATKSIEFIFALKP